MMRENTSVPRRFVRRREGYEYRDSSQPHIMRGISAALPPRLARDCELPVRSVDMRRKQFTPRLARDCELPDQERNGVI